MQHEIDLNYSLPKPSLYSHNFIFICISMNCRNYNDISFVGKNFSKKIQWKGINCKQSTRWQHLSRLKASAFSLQKIFSCYEKQQLIIGTGNAIWWVTEPHLFWLLCNFHCSITLKYPTLVHLSEHSIYRFLPKNSG